MANEFREDKTGFSSKTDLLMKTNEQIMFTFSLFHLIDLSESLSKVLAPRVNYLFVPQKTASAL